MKPPRSPEPRLTSSNDLHWSVIVVDDRNRGGQGQQFANGDWLAGIISRLQKLWLKVAGGKEVALHAALGPGSKVAIGVVGQVRDGVGLDKVATKLKLCIVGAILAKARQANGIGSRTDYF